MNKIFGYIGIIYVFIFIIRIICYNCQETKYNEYVKSSIEVVVRVNGDHHAKLIMNDIERMVLERTTIFYISDPKKSDKTIEELGKGGFD